MSIIRAARAARSISKARKAGKAASKVKKTTKQRQAKPKVKKSSDNRKNTTVTSGSKPRKGDVGTKENIKLERREEHGKDTAAGRKGTAYKPRRSSKAKRIDKIGTPGGTTTGSAGKRKQLQQKEKRKSRPKTGKTFK